MKRFFLLLFLLCSWVIMAQNHRIIADVDLNIETATLNITQEITFYNTSNVALNHIILNDWNHAFSAKNTALAKRFSDEFVRSFYYATEKDLGATTLFSVTNQHGNPLQHQRIPSQIDLIEIQLSEPIAPTESIKINIKYQVKIPNSRFTGYGHFSNQKIEIKDWMLFPARLDNGEFIKYSNVNLNDAANAQSDFEIELSTSKNTVLTSNLSVTKTSDNNYLLKGNTTNSIYLIAEPKASFRTYKNPIIEVETNLFDRNIDEFGTAITINKIVNFVHQQTGGTPLKKIVVSETDYKQNPFYGLNQLPSFLRPFPDSFLYEIKFLKAYAESYVKSNLNIDLRKDNWLVNAFEMHLIMAYLQTYYPDMKMVGNLSKVWILQGFYGTKMNFEDQFYYLYLMMARRNLDQPTGANKDELIKFNEQIAGKYKAGLDLRYLADYLGQDVVKNSIKAFYKLNANGQTSAINFKEIITLKSNQNIDWFYDEVIYSRNLIDYKISKVKKTNDSLAITIKNKGDATLPISLFAFSKDSVQKKIWLSNIKDDSTFTIKNENYDRLAVNYDGHIPEINMRNNHKTLKGFLSLNRPIRTTFFKDFENSERNQLFYIPEFRYNYYDGFTPGIRLSNKSMLKKPFVFELSPMYSFNTQSMVGSGYVGFENLIREGNLYSVNYALLTNYYHYAPDAAYSRFIPSVLFKIREPNFRDNKHQSIFVRYVNVNREQSRFAENLNNEKYSVFNLRYNNTQNEITQYFRFTTDVQVSDLFGKLSSQIEFRKLYQNNRQLNFRFFGGMFMHRSTDSDFFSFATDRPTDYLFDYNFYGRSESKGFFSQQYITADGGFKSKLTPYANQWIMATNISFNVWNWVEVYSDFGLIKNKFQSPEFLYDSGIRLNLVTDYFEVYFPMYSNLGWEPSASNYGERIRFVVTLDPNALVSLLTRKWL